MRLLPRCGAWWLGDCRLACGKGEMCSHGHPRGVLPSDRRSTLKPFARHVAQTQGSPAPNLGPSCRCHPLSSSRRWKRAEQWVRFHRFRPKVVLGTTSIALFDHVVGAREATFDRGYVPLVLSAAPLPGNGSL
jgi:hypothetical protein